MAAGSRSQERWAGQSCTTPGPGSGPRSPLCSAHGGTRGGTALPPPLAGAAVGLAGPSRPLPALSCGSGACCPPTCALPHSAKPLRSFFASYLKSLPGVRRKPPALPARPSEDSPVTVVWREFDKQVALPPSDPPWGPAGPGSGRAGGPADTRLLLGPSCTRPTWSRACTTSCGWSWPPTGPWRGPS